MFPDERWRWLIGHLRLLFSPLTGKGAAKSSPLWFAPFDRGGGTKSNAGAFPLRQELVPLNRYPRADWHSLFVGPADHERTERTAEHSQYP